MTLRLINRYVVIQDLSQLKIDCWLKTLSSERILLDVIAGYSLVYCRAGEGIMLLWCLPCCQAKSKAQGSGPCPVGVRGFESHPPHQTIAVTSKSSDSMRCKFN